MWITRNTDTNIETMWLVENTDTSWDWLQAVEGGSFCRQGAAAIQGSQASEPIKWKQHLSIVCYSLRGTYQWNEKDTCQASLKEEKKTNFHISVKWEGWKGPHQTCSSSPGQTYTLGVPAKSKAAKDSVIEVAPPGIAWEWQTLVQPVMRRRIEGRSRR